MTCQFALFVPFVARLFTPIALSVNLPLGAVFRRCMYALRTKRERERKREREGGGGRKDHDRARTRGGKERKRGSRGEWKRDGSIYRLLSSDASGITFVRFAGVDDVVARGVGVISTREGTYVPITVPSLFPSCAHIRTHLLAVIPASFRPFYLFHRPYSRTPFPSATLLGESRSQHSAPRVVPSLSLVVARF